MNRIIILCWSLVIHVKNYKYNLGSINLQRTRNIWRNQLSSDPFQGHWVRCRSASKLFGPQMLTTKMFTVAECSRKQVWYFLVLMSAWYLAHSTINAKISPAVISNESHGYIIFFQHHHSIDSFGSCLNFFPPRQLGPVGPKLQGRVQCWYILCTLKARNKGLRLTSRMSGICRILGGMCIWFWVHLRTQYNSKG